jgi:regulatory protein
MGRITALKAQARNRQRVNVFIDDEYRCAMYAITAAWLHIGQEISDEQLAQLLEKDAREAAMQQAMRLLERRERTTAEIERKLRQGGFDEALIAQVTARLQETGLINDARFAQRFVESRANAHPRSKRALAVELRQRGLSDAEIANATVEVDEDAAAYRAALKQSRRLHALEWPEFRQKLGAFLLRRGFNYEISASVTRRIWQEQHSEENNI